MAEPGKSQSQSQGGGNLKYILGGLLLLGGAGVVVFMLQPPPAPAPKPDPTPPPSVERVNPMAQPELILDEPLDAGAGQPVDEQPAEEPAEKPKPQAKAVRGGEWDCSGDLSRQSLQAVIDKNRAQVRNCYERRLKVNNLLQGDLKLKLKIGNGGKVSAVAVSGSLKDNEVFGCVRNVAQRWTFEAPTGGSCAVVQVPFQFAPMGN